MGEFYWFISMRKTPWSLNRFRRSRVESIAFDSRLTEGAHENQNLAVPLDPLGRRQRKPIVDLAHVDAGVDRRLPGTFIWLIRT